MKHKIGCVVVLGIGAASLLGAIALLMPLRPIANKVSSDSNAERTEQRLPLQALQQEESQRLCIDQTPVQVADLSFSRTSRQSIELTWSDSWDEVVQEYQLKKRAVGDTQSSWIAVGTCSSDGLSDGTSYRLMDILETSEPVQFEYRVDITVATSDRYRAMEGVSIPASNVMVCIDPGHFDDGSQLLTPEADGYGEGLFVLQIALALRECLRTEYGIDSYLTRETDSITLDGYTNWELDSGFISLRGAYSAQKDSDLFLSLHTNANENGANGYPTWAQPTSITKPLLIVNTVAAESEQAIAIANAIGAQLAQANLACGIADRLAFSPGTLGALQAWSTSLNDSVELSGTVVYRLNQEGADYYGVLRGAAGVQVSGIIIEHGFHTVDVMRQKAVDGTLASQWAKADASGVAQGLGFQALKDRTN